MTAGPVPRAKLAIWARIRRAVSSSPKLRAWLVHALDLDPLPYGDGHFYSPVVDAGQAERDAATLWPETPAPVMDLDFREDEQRRVIAEVLRPCVGDFDYPPGPEQAVDGLAFHTENGQYGGLDARLLFCFMRQLAPERVVEVGSGYSTLLMRDVNRRFLDGRTSIRCIEPYPRDFLLDPDAGIELHRCPVQQVPIERFAELRAGDLLFIDSSHVAKTGSDVNFLYFEVLPRLAAGVVVHVHDIFLPFEYPRQWVVDDRRSWNEQYLLRALLMDSGAYQVLFGAAYAHRFLARELDAVLDAAGQPRCSGASFWMIKREPAARPAACIRP